jgi:hypothetical protein
MAIKIDLKRSAVPGRVPKISDLDLGEIAMNTYDGIAYMKKNVGGVETVIPIGSSGSGSGGGITSLSVASTNGFNGSVAGSTALTLTISTTVTGMLKGNGTAIFAATPGTDYLTSTAGTALAAVSSSYALYSTTASYAMNGGGGGGTIIISGSNTTGSFTNLSTWVFNHNLNYQSVIVEAFDTNNYQIIPQTVQLTDANTVTLTFPVNTSGYAIASIGGIGGSSTSGSSISSSYASYATLAATASYFSGSISATLSSLGDVTISSPTYLQPLVYDSFSLKWINTGSINANLQGTSSYAVTASYALQTLSASYSTQTTSASYSISTSYASYSSTSSYFNGNIINISSSAIINQNTSSLTSGGFTISSNPTGSYTSAFYKYNIISGSNARAGEFIVFWNNNTLQSTDYSAIDVGNTQNIVFTSSISGGNINLLTSLPTAGWIIKTLINLL